MSRTVFQPSAFQTQAKPFPFTGHGEHTRVE